MASLIRSELFKSLRHRFTDVTIIAQGTEEIGEEKIRTHRLVLSLYSGFFRDVIFSHGKEKDAEEVTIVVNSARIFLILVESFYTGDTKRIIAKMNPADSIKTLSLCSYLQMDIRFISLLMKIKPEKDNMPDLALLIRELGEDKNPRICDWFYGNVIRLGCDPTSYKELLNNLTTKLIVSGVKLTVYHGEPLVPSEYGNYMINDIEVSMIMNDKSQLLIVTWKTKIDEESESEVDDEPSTYHLLTIDPFTLKEIDDTTLCQGNYLCDAYIAQRGDMVVVSLETRVCIIFESHVNNDYVFDSQVISVDISPKDNKVLILTEDGNIHFINTSQEEVSKLEFNRKTTSCCAKFSPTGNDIFLLTRDALFMLPLIKKQEKMKTIPLSQGKWSNLEIRGNKLYIIGKKKSSDHSFNIMHIFDITNDPLLIDYLEFSCQGKLVLGIQGKQAIIGTSDSLELWSLNPFKQLQIINCSGDDRKLVLMEKIIL